MAKRTISKATRESWRLARADPAAELRKLLAGYAKAIPDHARPAYRRLREAVDRTGTLVPCHDIDAFTATEREHTQNAPQALAARICPTCPVLDECRAYGIANPNEVGIYGGMTQTERRATASEATPKPIDPR